MAEPSALQRGFIGAMLSPLKFRLYTLRSIPVAAFIGTRVRSLTLEECSTTVPFRWSSTNPFRSTYFAALNATAELSTGILAMAHLYPHRQDVAMLMVDCSAEFLKKATDLTTFTSTDGSQVRSVIERAIATGEAGTCTMTTVGRNETGDIVARMNFTWSFKKRAR